MTDEVLQRVKEERDILHNTQNKEEYLDWNCLAHELPSKHIYRMKAKRA